MKRRQFFRLRLADDLLGVGFAEEGKGGAGRPGRRLDDIGDVAGPFLAGRRIYILIVKIVELRRAVRIGAQLESRQVVSGNILTVGSQVVVLTIGDALQLAETE